MDLLQSEFDPVHVGHFREVGCGDQLSVQVIGPGVIGALESSRHRARFGGANLRAAVTADIEERPYLARAAPGYQNGFRAHLDRAVVTGLWNVGGSHRTEPHPLEDLRLLEGKDVRVSVEVPGQCRN